MRARSDATGSVLCMWQPKPSMSCPAQPSPMCSSAGARRTCRQPEISNSRSKLRITSVVKQTLSFVFSNRRGSSGVLGKRERALRFAGERRVGARWRRRHSTQRRARNRTRCIPPLSASISPDSQRLFCRRVGAAPCGRRVRGSCGSALERAGRGMRVWEWR